MYKPVKIINTRSELINEKNKSGIYSWVNQSNNKRYIGSAKCLYTRLSRYYHNQYLNRNRNTLIVKALTKYGYENFTIEIIEYCSSQKLLAREQYYIDLLKPEYNISLIAGSTLGVLHRPETKKLLSALALGRKVSIETRQKMSISKLGDKNFWYGKTMPNEFKENLRKVALARTKDHNPGYTVTLTNVLTNEIKVFKSLRAAGSFLNITYSRLHNYNGLIFKDKYLVTIDTSMGSANAKSKI